MNFFSLGDVSVVVDLAHNEAGLEALLEIMNGVRRPGARLLLGLGAVGDRQDELIEQARRDRRPRQPTWSPSRTRPHYLRGREVEELDALLRAGAERVGVTDVESFPTGGRRRWPAWSRRPSPATWSGLMCHAERQQVYDWLAEHGATADGPEVLAAKVRTARG